MSEFGRTFRENGSRGTDHGHGTTRMVLAVPAQRAASPASRRWSVSPRCTVAAITVLNDYRVLLAGLLGRLYAGCGAAGAGGLMRGWQRGWGLV